MGKAKTYNSIVGLYLLTFMDGKVEWQGRVLGADGDDVLVGLHEWAFGYSSGAVGLLKRADLYDRKRVRLFWDEEVWRDAATEASRRNAAA